MFLAAHKAQVMTFSQLLKTHANVSSAPGRLFRSTLSQQGTPFSIGAVWLSPWLLSEMSDSSHLPIHHVHQRNGPQNAL
jgi:hypothetical protein